MDQSTLMLVQLLVQFKAAAIIVYVLQRLKSSKYVPWVRQETAKLNRVLAVIASIAATLGVHTTFNHETGVLTITGLTIASVTAFAGKWLTQFITQELIYQAAGKNGNGNGKPFLPLSGGNPIDIAAKAAAAAGTTSQAIGSAPPKS